MVNKCVVPGCKSGYDSSDKVPSFRFPFKRPDLLKKWIQFVGLENWEPSPHSVICSKHFEENLIRGKKRKKLNWGCTHPIPTIRIPTISTNRRKRPSTSNIFPDSESQKVPRISQTEREDLEKKDRINIFSELSKKHCPAGYNCHKTESCIVFYNVVFDEILVVRETIKIDSDLDVELRVYGDLVLLPLWFTKGQHTKLASISSTLKKLAEYLQSRSEEINTTSPAASKGTSTAPPVSKTPVAPKPTSKVPNTVKGNVDTSFFLVCSIIILFVMLFRISCSNIICLQSHFINAVVLISAVYSAAMYISSNFFRAFRELFFTLPIFELPAGVGKLLCKQLLGKKGYLVTITSY